MNTLNHFIKRETVQLSAMVLLFLLVYIVPISSIFQSSLSQHFSHRLLILAISGYVVWMKRDRLRRTQIRPALIPGSLVMVMSSIILMAGAFSGTPLLEGLSWVIGIFGMVWLLLGSSIMRIIVIPLSFLIFMFPIFDKLFRGYTDHLQLVAAFIGAIFLQTAGMSILHVRDVIQLPHITLVVGEACNGVNHMIALMMLGAFLGYVTETKWFVKLMFVIMGLVVGIIANGLRVALIGIWTRYFGEASFHGPFDFFYSSFVFFVGLVVVIVFRIVLLKRNVEKPTAITPAGAGIQKPMSFMDSCFAKNDKNRDRKYFQFCYVIAVLILVSTWTYKTLARPVPLDLKKGFSEIGMNVKNWEWKKVDSLQEPYETGNFDLVTKRIYYDESGNQIRLFIGYLRSQERGKNIDYYPHGIDQKRASKILIQSNPSGSFEIGHTTYQGNNALRQLYFWYDINGRIIPNRNGAKLATIVNAFSRRRTNGAVVVVSTDVKGRGQEKERENATLQFIKTILPLVQASLNDST